MGDEGDFWREMNSQKKEYQKTLKPIIEKLINHKDCIKVGDHFRINNWDFWWTGTAFNIKTKKRINVKKLIKII